MKKRELFESILSRVEEETELSRSVILSSSRCEEVVDARALLTKLLAEQGLYAAQIAALTGREAGSVRKMIADFRSRLCHSPVLAAIYEKLRCNIRIT